MTDAATDKTSIIVADDDPLALRMYERILGERFDLRMCVDGGEVLAEFALSPARLVILTTICRGWMGGRRPRRYASRR
mgnify:CR=1 FL=1